MYTVRNFHDMHKRLRSPNNLLFLHQIINKTDFPSLGDELAEPRPDMNIKVTAFTVSKKSNNTDGKLLITIHIKCLLVQSIDLDEMAHFSCPIWI